VKLDTVLKPAKKTGTVYLVGAGPGDPGLLTLRGAQVLSRADVVVYDYLASPKLLELAPKQARCIYVGKAGSNHTLCQDDINSLLVSEALVGHMVVRLKGGDPYIFGRGAEEALVLFDAGVPFEVVPGVTSAIAAAAAAGIPLTHRDMGSQIGILTGHEKPGKKGSALDFEALARLGTLSVVMGVENMENIITQLIGAGRDPGTPAALIQWGATDRQRVASGTLGDLPLEVKKAGLSSPALLVIGEVVRLRDRLNWFENRPLFGKTVLVTRTRQQAGRLSAALRDLGARVEERPTIEICPVSPNPALGAALDRLSRYDYLILTSPNGASIFMEALLGRGLDGRSLHGLKIAVIGSGTAEALSAFGIKPDMMPGRFIAEGLLELFTHQPPGGVLLPRASKGRDILPDGLKKLGFELDVIPLYDTITADWSGFENLCFSRYNDNLPNSDRTPTETIDVDLATLTSASTAQGLAEHIPEVVRGSVQVASIGPITTKTAQSLGFNVVTEAKSSTIDSLVEAVAECLS
jgi:uroporphyrinogen III methyltransferase/synthase